MIEFKPYVERRQRVEAFQFIEASQAERVAYYLGAHDYTLHSDDDGWNFWVEAAAFTGDQMLLVRVGRGDWLVRKGRRVDVVPHAEFYRAWEEEK